MPDCGIPLVVAVFGYDVVLVLLSLNEKLKKLFDF